VIIASDLPLAGAPDNTVALMHAIQLAVSRQPTISGFRLEYLPLDDSLGNSPSAMLGVQNVKRMIADTRVVGMIGPYTSYATWDEIPRANDADLVMISPSSTDVCLTTLPSCTDRLTALRESRPINFFRIAGVDSKQGTAMGRYAASLGLKRVAVVNQWGDDPGAPLVDQFKREFAAGGGSVVLTTDLPWDATSDGQPNFTAFLGEAKAAGAQAIYGVGDHGTGICALGPQMRTGFQYLFATDGAVGDDACLADSTDPSVRVLGTVPDVDARYLDDARAKAVVDAYARAYPNDKQLPSYTFAAYDCALILIDAITRVIQANGGGSPTRVQVRDEVAHGRFSDGITGTYAFDANGDAISPLMTMWRAAGRHWVFVQRMDVSPKPI